MIISASRRTDIPAFYSAWFINRVRTGWCQVPNPLNYNQLSYVSLKAKDVSAIVFWSKNPRPMLKYLDELDQQGLRYYFQFTINDYPRILEPKVPPVEERLNTFRELSSRLQPIRVVWRYDPIIISNLTPASLHLEKFSHIAQSLRGYTRRVMVSLVDYYQKTNRRLSVLESRGVKFEKETQHSAATSELLAKIAVIAKQNDLEIFTCAEQFDFSAVGIPPGQCIDGELIKRIWSIEVDMDKDPTQRAACLCVVSKDIGVNDTCLHGCPYCYATRNLRLAKRRALQHDPTSPVLWGRSRPLSEAEEADQLKARLL